jgi:hypothetical protein
MTDIYKSSKNELDKAIFVVDRHNRFLETGLKTEEPTSGIKLTLHKSIVLDLHVQRETKDKRDLVYSEMLIKIVNRKIESLLPAMLTEALDEIRANMQLHLLSSKESLLVQLAEIEALEKSSFEVEKPKSVVSPIDDHSEKP